MDSSSLASVDSRPSSKTPLSLLFESWVQEYVPTSPRKRPQGFSLISREIALCILDNLDDPVDKVCLALTNKSLWTFLRSRLNLDQFKLSGTLPSRVNESRGIIKRWPFFESPRWKLIERLEDSFWLCCSGCLRLQPKSEFFASEVYREPTDRFCRAPGLITLCPHVFLTYKKCVSLQAELYKALYKEDLDEDSFSLLLDHLRHECVLETENTKVTLSFLPRLSSGRKHLTFSCNYTVTNFTEENLQRWMKEFGDDALLLCPHRNILSHVKDMLKTNSIWAERMILGERTNTKDVWCKFCCTHYSSFKQITSGIGGGTTVAFRAQRHIGKGWGLKHGKAGTADQNRLRDWVRRTDLANVIGVDIDQKLQLLRFKAPPVAGPLESPTLPTSSWKLGSSYFQF